ncbi:vwa containing family protein [Leptolyngbya sp. Heron Island J]|uniref:VWA domain-containing protein n=1 Tax=Leptolyngbya sp. Heron Island J TaxID=1385935 RepID=UPI0003B97E20|nr:VWA domain-containing protein [Leptolyngbya sp. Heron Island J]ESA34525.1 vwa containing family protein [Leptolyngbya sp. Heron Island J]
MQAKDLPLFELFTRLQEAGLPLGLDEYAILVKALQAGFGVHDQATLSRLCQTLWVKNEEESQIFDYHFAEIIGPTARSRSEIAPTNSQTTYLHQESISSHGIATQKSRRLLNRAIIIFTLFLVSLAGLKLMRIEQEDINSPSPSLEQQQTTPNNSVTETEETPAGQQQQITPNNPGKSTEETPKVPITLLVFSVGSMLCGTCVSWLFIRQLTVLRNAAPDDRNADITTQIDTFQTEMITLDKGEVHLAEVFQESTNQNASTPRIQKIRRDEYFPLTRRQMRQGWRYLRRSSRQGPKTEFDVEGTVNQIANQGLFLEVLMRAPRSNRSDLVLLLDQDGSMVPFHSLSKQFMDTALRSGRLGNASVYYFHNCPRKYLYHDAQLQESEHLDHFLNRRLSLKSFVVIISDAGAARGGLNTNRILQTQEFLDQLKKWARSIVWLNPLPRNRWERTTANEIANFVPMFEINRTEFQSAIDTLRGQRKGYTTFSKTVL